MTCFHGEIRKTIYSIQSLSKAVLCNDLTHLAKNNPSMGFHGEIRKILILSLLGKNFSRQVFEIFFLIFFFPESKL